MLPLLVAHTQQVINYHFFVLPSPAQPRSRLCHESSGGYAKHRYNWHVVNAVGRERTVNCLEALAKNVGTCNFFYCQKKHTSTILARLFEKLPHFHGPTTQSLKTVAAIARPKRIPHSCGTLPIFSLSNTNADLMEERPYYSRKVFLLCISSLMQGQSATKSRRTPYHCALLHTSTPS